MFLSKWTVAPAGTGWRLTDLNSFIIPAEMTVTVLFFGSLSELAGTGTRFYHNVGSLGELRLRLADDYPGIVHFDCRISVNNVMTDEDMELNDGDEVAFLAPFA